MQKVGFAVCFTVVILGAVLLIISPITYKKEYYVVVDTYSFSPGQPLTFYSTFDPNGTYSFELKGINWTSPAPIDHNLSVGNGTYLESVASQPFEPPWVWNWTYWGPTARSTLNVTFFYWGKIGQEIERTTTPASLEISELKETTYRRTYLIYVGLPLLVIGAILITVVELTDSQKSQSSRNAC
jgi:hypothetical protein